MDKQFTELVELFQQLRDPKTGCPWDIKQTHESLKPFLIEESYELLDAINAKDSTHICEELGDVLLQVILHSQIAADNNNFSIKEVIEGLKEKIITRHPHIFGEVEVTSAEQVKENWNKIKNKDKKKQSVLDNIPKANPALLKAHEMGLKVATVNFDWNKAEDVFSKVKEEILELESAIKEKNQSNIEEELGDLLFSIAQLSRKLKINPEISLQKSCSKFENRFKKLESIAGKTLDTLSQDELEKLWQQVKLQD